MFFTKKFYTEKEIKEMLINYHEHDRKGIERLNNLKYFVANKNYSRLEVMQEYDIVELDEENNLIKFTDSSKTKNKVKVLVSYKYYDKDDISAEYRMDRSFYETTIDRFEVIYTDWIGTQDYVFYFNTTNKYEKEVGGCYFNMNQTSFVRDPEFEKYLVERSTIKTGEVMEIIMYSQKYLLCSKYSQNEILKEFDTEILKDFTFDSSIPYITTFYNGIRVLVFLDTNDEFNKKAVAKISEFLVEEKYKDYIHDQIKSIHKLYKDWYNEDEREFDFIEDLDEYEKQYYLTSISAYAKAKGAVSISFMDKVDSFAGHGVHIDISKNGKAKKFDI